MGNPRREVYVDVLMDTERFTRCFQEGLARGRNGKMPIPERFEMDNARVLQDWTGKPPVSADSGCGPARSRPT